jgi:hypothetical protein
MTTASTKDHLTLKNQPTMKPVHFEAHCALRENDPLWNTIRNISIEIGYPGIAGKTLWKQIGWLQTGAGAFNRTIVHALWDRALATQILFFDFLAVQTPETGEVEKSYRLRKTITRSDGHVLPSREILIQEGQYADEHFVLEVHYPAAL